jgi:hypothetical protein
MSNPTGTSQTPNIPSHWRHKTKMQTNQYSFGKTCAKPQLSPGSEFRPAMVPFINVDDDFARYVAGVDVSIEFQD